MSTTFTVPDSYQNTEATQEIWIFSFPAPSLGSVLLSLEHGFPNLDSNPEIFFPLLFILKSWAIPQ